MANEKNQKTTDAIENINESLTSIEQKVQNNQKTVMWACIAVVAVILVVAGYFYGIYNPGKEAADNAIGEADITLALGNDSLAVEQYKQVAAEHGHDAGNRAALNAAVLLYKEGKYEEALSYLQDYKASESIIGASSKALEGDCYVNLKKYPEAISCFAEATEISDNNPYYTPYFMMKEATVQHELKDYKAEAALYKEIHEKYPQFAAATQIDIEKYIARAEALAGEAK